MISSKCWRKNIPDRFSSILEKNSGHWEFQPNVRNGCSCCFLWCFREPPVQCHTQYSCTLLPTTRNQVWLRCAALNNNTSSWQMWIIEHINCSGRAFRWCVHAGVWNPWPGCFSKPNPTLRLLLAPLCCASFRKPDSILERHTAQIHTLERGYSRPSLGKKISFLCLKCGCAHRTAEDPLRFVSSV